MSFEYRPRGRAAGITRLVVIGLALAWAVPCVAQGPSTPATPPDSSGALVPDPLPAAAPAVSSTPPDYPRGKISGYMFGDVYYNLAGEPRHLYDAKGVDQGQVGIDGKKNIGRDLNGIQFRRVYFQLDNDPSARLSTRFRLEMDSRELTSGGKLGVFVKNAYLQVKSALPRCDLYFGEITTPTFENAEAFWQYRSIEKTLPDFWGLRSSSDLGVEAKGYADGGHHVGYAAMIGEGSGQKPGSGRFKAFYLALPLRLGDMRVEPYVDHQAVRANPNLTAVSDTVVNKDLATWALFAGYEFRRWALGVQAVDRVSRQGPSRSIEPRGVSVFARGSLAPSLAAFARFDAWQPDRNAPDRVDVQLWIGGLDWQPSRDLHVMPNVEATQYQARGRGVVPAHHDVQVRLTLYYLFSRPQG